MNIVEKRVAYLYSAILFGVYHIMIFQTWFKWQITLLSLFGLILGGLLFNWMDKKTGTFITSWIAHLFADIAVIVIGLKMFGII